MSSYQYCKTLTPSDNVFYILLPKMNGYHLNFRTRRQPGKERVCLQLVPVSSPHSMSKSSRRMSKSSRG